ncbi:GNAT family N-acetyltransferase [Colwellia ponticola]|uniref:GNAT family N-acetyltransferase n=1 Tax=Colwellia ponticola TaxID=2304625 RepID=A0A8H2JIR4_9GAMM|nr:GNAT family N-acetyltransferase [Colwellia ponticola]TMM41890.1 GNAT family N-acetyltransferase [Colwellia ponticola]
MQITLIQADYHNEQHGKDLIMLLNAYALDPMGGGEALADDVQQNLVASLAKRHDFLTLLCYVDDKPAGILNCVEGFSTFKAKPLLNIHDCGVLKEYRGLGLSQQLFNEAEKISRQRGYCKLTLEVLEGNIVAQNAYKKLGFSGYELDENTGNAMFWEKVL